MTAEIVHIEDLRATRIPGGPAARTNVNRHLPLHPITPHCVPGVCAHPDTTGGDQE